MIHNFKDWMRAIQWVDPESLNNVDIAASDFPLDTAGWRFVVILLSIGATAANWTIDVEASATSGGSYLDVGGATFVTTAAGSDDTRFVGILDTQGGATNMNRFLQLTGTGASGAVLIGVNVILINPDYSTERIDYATGEADELAFEV